MAPRASTTASRSLIMSTSCLRYVPRDPPDGTWLVSRRGPYRARPRRALPADGGAPGRGDPDGREVAVRAEVGWLPRRPRERWRRASALEPQRPAPAALLPGAADPWRPPAAALGHRRRDRHRARRKALLRRDADAP